MVEIVVQKEINYSKFSILRLRDETVINDLTKTEIIENLKLSKQTKFNTIELLDFIGKTFNRLIICCSIELPWYFGPYYALFASTNIIPIVCENHLHIVYSLFSILFILYCILLGSHDRLRFRIPHYSDLCYGSFCFHLIQIILRKYSLNMNCICNYHFQQI